MTYYVFECISLYSFLLVALGTTNVYITDHIYCHDNFASLSEVEKSYFPLGLFTLPNL